MKLKIQPNVCQSILVHTIFRTLLRSEIDKPESLIIKHMVASAWVTVEVTIYRSWSCIVLLHLVNNNYFL